MKLKNETLIKNFLIYGFGKSGISSLKYLKKKNRCFIYDDDNKKIKNKYKKFFISKSKQVYLFVISTPFYFLSFSIKSIESSSSSSINSNSL